MKYYVVSPEDFEQEAIKRLDGAVDTYAGASTEKDLRKSRKPLKKLVSRAGVEPATR